MVGGVHSKHIISAYHGYNGVGKARRFPYRWWLGKYESYLLNLYKRETFYYADSHIEKVFESFPVNVCLSKVTAARLYEYAVLRRREGISDCTTAMQFKEVEKFYTWLIEYHGLPLKNPCDGKKLPSQKQQEALDLDGFRALLNAIDDVRVRNYVIALAHNRQLKTGLAPTTVGHRIHQAGLKANLPWVRLISLRQALKYSPWLSHICARFNEEYEDIT